MSERLRRWTRNPLGSARRGSNPLGVALRSTSNNNLRAKALPGRLELPTLRLTASRSNQLSYGSLQTATITLLIDKKQNPKGGRSRTYQTQQTIQIPILAQWDILQSGILVISALKMPWQNEKRETRCRCAIPPTVINQFFLAAEKQLCDRSSAHTPAPWCSRSSFCVLASFA